jgi:site-specific DNA-methyltransferase (adenine-specific)
MTKHAANSPTPPEATPPASAPRANRTAPAPPPTAKTTPTPWATLNDPDTSIYVGDCRELLRSVPTLYEAADVSGAGAVDLIFADPPFNWARDYDRHKAGDAWKDTLADEEYLRFTKEWLDACVRVLKPTGSLWVNIPDTWAAEIVVHLKGSEDADGKPREKLHMMNWCIWHYRFGQNTMRRFINSKVHALYFVKDRDERTWNVDDILEASDRATTYFDPRTMNKKAGRSGLRVPMDVWYGKYFGRVQGNNKERRANHDNQIPEAYMERVTRACSNEGDLVVDPFLGSGTTGVIARELDRRFIGFEYAESNARSAWSRIESGPVRVRKDEPSRHASAIFSPRRASPAARAATQSEAAD